VEKIGRCRFQVSNEGSASLAVAHVQCVSPAQRQCTRIGMTVPYEELSQDKRSLLLKKARIEEVCYLLRIVLLELLIGFAQSSFEGSLLGFRP